MSKKNRLIVLLYVAALCSQNLCAQPRVMGVEEMFRLADENSRSVQVYATGKEAASEALKTARNQRLLDITASVSGSYWGNGKLWDRDFGNAMKIDMPHWGNNFSLEVQQMIYTGGAVNSGIELASLGKRQAELGWEKNLELARQVIADMQARRGQGTVLQNDITRYEFQQESLKLQLARVTDACKIMNHRLVTALRLSEQTLVVPDSALLEVEVQALAESDWQELAMRSNITLKQTETDIEVNKQLVKRERSERLPKISLFAAEHLDGPITIEVPVLDNNFNYWYVGVNVSYNFSALFKNARKLKQAKLNVRRAQETHELAQEQVENAVQASYTDFLTAFTELKTQEKNVQLANENYSVTSNRYRNDLALLTDMLDAGNTKLSADLALANARIDLIYHYYQMKYVTHTL
ncbi:TolC family protein [Bacteroidales bacterium SW299]|nr:TolC family protein [Bacteroidales bacterium SW299]